MPVPRSYFLDVAWGWEVSNSGSVLGGRLDSTELNLPPGKPELLGVEHQAIRVAVGENAEYTLESHLNCVRPCDDVVHNLLEVLDGGGSWTVFHDGVRVPAVAVP